MTTREVFDIFSIAAKVVSTSPSALESVRLQLLRVCENLVPPEEFAAQQCLALWQRFERAVLSDQLQNKLIAGRALLRELDELGQRYDLPPLPDFDALAASLVAPDAAVDGACAETLVKLREKLVELTAQASFSGMRVGEVLRRLRAAEREPLLRDAVRGGIIDRGESHLLLRWFAKGGDVGSQDTVLLDVLHKVGLWLVKARLDLC